MLIRPFTAADAEAVAAMVAALNAEEGHDPATAASAALAFYAAIGAQAGEEIRAFSLRHHAFDRLAESP